MPSLAKILSLTQNIVKRCKITLAGKDNTDYRVQQVSANGKAIDAEIWAPYGMSYNIPVNSLCTYLQVGGDQANLIVLPDRSQDRVKDLKPGEVAYFNPLTQSRTVYRENGDIEVITSGTQGDLITTIKGDHTVTIEGASTVNITGDCNLTIGGVANIDVATANWTGDFNLDGNLNVTGDADVDGDIDGTTITGSSDVKTGSISLKTHKHVGSPTAPTGSITPTGAPF